MSVSLQAINGQAIDRHLLGLKMIALEEKLPLPAIFADKAYNKALHYKLSTSQVCAMLENNIMEKMQYSFTLAFIEIWSTIGAKSF